MLCSDRAQDAFDKVTLPPFYCLKRTFLSPQRFEEVSACEALDEVTHAQARSCPVFRNSGGLHRGPAHAEEYRGTFAQRMACTPDVFKLCGSEIPDVGRIVVCLRQNQSQLAGPCRAVFESNAEATGDDIAARATGGVVKAGSHQ